MSGWYRSGARDVHTCGVMQFWLASQSSDRASLTSGWCTVPSFFGTSTRSSHSGKPFDTSFWMKPFRPMPDGIALHRDRAAANVRQHDRRDRLVVRRELALGDPVVGEEHLLGMRDHGRSLTTSRAALSVRTPSSRGWRSLSCTVHSMKATCTTISGRTQCARRRGSPVALVNGGLSISSAIELRAQVEQQLGVEAGADLAGKDEVVALEVADEQRTETDARALRIGEAADDQLLARLALHLEPVRRAAMLVGRVAPLGDDAFPALRAGALPRLVIVERGDASQRRLAAAALSAARGARRAAAT